VIAIIATVNAAAIAVRASIWLSWVKIQSKFKPSAYPPIDADQGRKTKGRRLA
jgi:hypothetical protein